MKVLAFLNLHQSPSLGPLTRTRSTSTVSFLGRYALMDFMLSNFSNSGIDRVATLVDVHPHSVLKHLGSRNTFNINTKIGFEVVAYNESGSRFGPRYNTDIANILYNDWIIRNSDPDYVVVAPGHFVGPLDFKPVLKQHVARHADITIVYKNVDNARQHFIGRPALDIGEDGRILNHRPNKGEKEHRAISIGAYVISRAKFEEMLKNAQEISPFYTLADMITYLIGRGEQIDTYEYKGYLRCFDSYEHYLEYSFELLHYPLRKQLFLQSWPIYTVTNDTPPAKYEKNADVSNSFVANGCLIEGTVKNSILSRHIHVEEGAVIENSIVFTNSTVKANRIVRHALLDKGAEVAIATEIDGKVDDVIYIKKGDRV